MKFVILLLCMLLASCGDGSTLKKDFDRSNEPIVVTIKVFETRGEMQRAYEQATGRKDLTLKGWSLWVRNQASTKTCDVYVVRPRNIDDENMDTWGHELAHCVYGEFH